MAQPITIVHLRGGISRSVAELAGRQHGVVARRQLLAVGVTQRSIERALEAGRLHTLHKGVYAVGHRALTPRGNWMAAVLAAGPDAVLSHRAAAALWGIRDGVAVEVSAPSGVRRRGIVGHRATIPADERTVCDGIPTTTVARTLLDLAAVVPQDQLERAMRVSESRRLTDLTFLGALVARYPNRAGTRAIRAIAGDARLGLDRINSGLEEAARKFIATTGLPQPSFNVTVLGYECDVVWWEQRVILEVDGPHHATPLQRAEDARRDRRLIAAGWRPVRATEHQVDRERRAVEADLRVLLATAPSA